MVRREETDRSPSASRCSSPAGASPASVSAGAPSSRPQALGEIPMARAGCQEPLRREPARGPQHQVKPAASTDLQPESRAGHVAAKAMFAMPQSGGKRIAGLGGVGGAARVQGEERNTRGPSAPLWSGQGGSYKPMAKSSRAQRESEGVVVPRIVVTNNTTGGKDPCSGPVEGASTRKGMTGEPGSNHPAEASLSVNVRQSRYRLGVRPIPGRVCAVRDRSPRRSDLRRAPRLWSATRFGGVTPYSDRPPVSRVREIRTHGLNGGLANSRSMTGHK